MQELYDGDGRTLTTLHAFWNANTFLHMLLMLNMEILIVTPNTRVVITAWVNSLVKLSSLLQRPLLWRGSNTQATQLNIVFCLPKVRKNLSTLSQKKFSGCLPHVQNTSTKCSLPFVNM